MKSMIKKSIFAMFALMAVSAMFVGCEKEDPNNPNDAEFTVYVYFGDEWTPFEGQTGVQFSLDKQGVIAIEDDGTTVSFVGLTVGQAVITAVKGSETAKATVNVIAATGGEDNVPKSGCIKYQNTSDGSIFVITFDEYGKKFRIDELVDYFAVSVINDIDRTAFGYDKEHGWVDVPYTYDGWAAYETSVFLWKTYKAVAMFGQKGTAVIAGKTCNTYTLPENIVLAEWNGIMLKMAGSGENCTAIQVIEPIPSNAFTKTLINWE